MEREIKQRLLGGLVLVAGAALFLPVLLDGSGASLTVPPLPAPPRVAGVDEIAPSLEAKVEAATQAVDAAHAGRETGAPETAEAAPEASDASAPAEVAPAAAAPAAAGQPRLAAEQAALEKARQEKAAPETAAPAKAAAAAAPARKPATTITPPAAWVVQVASLSSRDKAEALVQKLRRKNYPAVISPQGSAWKVVVGPELSRDVAESMKAKLAADPDLRLNGWVQSYKP